MHLVPKFYEKPKTYVINFYDYNYKLGDDPIFTTKGHYEQSIAAATTDLRAFYMYRSDADLNANERYGFKGWQSEADFNKQVENPDMIDLHSTLIRRDLNLFAYYEIEDVTKVASPMLIFNIDAGAISLKSEYADLVTGKITIPSKDGSNNTISSIGSFGAGKNIEEVYFLPDAEHIRITTSAFESSNVKNVYLPASIKYIGDSAFKEANNLEHITLNDNIESLGIDAFRSNGTTRKMHIDRLPESLVSIGGGCFYNGGPNVTISNLPLSVKTIGAYAFSFCPNVAICEFPEHSTGTDYTIGSGAFTNCGKVDSVTTITINSPWSLPKDKTYYGVFGRAESNGDEGYPNVTMINMHSNLYNALGGTEIDAIEACFGQIAPENEEAYENKFTVASISETLKEV